MRLPYIMKIKARSFPIKFITLGESLTHCQTSGLFRFRKKGAWNPVTPSKWWMTKWVSEWMIECRTGWDSEQKVFLKIGKLLFNCFPRGSVVKIHLPMQEMQVWSLGQEDPQEKEMATHCSILAWEVSWTEEPGRLPSMGSQKSRTQLNN